MLEIVHERGQFVRLREPCTTRAGIESLLLRGLNCGPSIRCEVDVVAQEQAQRNTKCGREHDHNEHDDVQLSREHIARFCGERIGPKDGVQCNVGAAKGRICQEQKEVPVIKDTDGCVQEHAVVVKPHDQSSCSVAVVGSVRLAQSALSAVSHGAVGLALVSVLDLGLGGYDTRRYGTNLMQAVEQVENDECKAGPREETPQDTPKPSVVPQS